jgi:hypothetical protein
MLDSASWVYDAEVSNGVLDTRRCEFDIQLMNLATDKDDERGW